MVYTSVPNQHHNLRYVSMLIQFLVHFSSLPQLRNTAYISQPWEYCLAQLLSSERAKHFYNLPTNNSWHYSWNPTLSRTYIACSKVFDQQTYLLFKQAKKKNYKRIKDILHNNNYHIMLHECYNANTLCRA